MKTSELRRILKDSAATTTQFPFRKFRQRGGRGKRRGPGEMNGTEKKYDAILDAQYRAGEIAWYAFEAVTFKLAPDTRYTPDFVVMLNDGAIEFREVKGGTKDKATGKRKPFIEEDAKLKIKMAAELLPFRFSIVFPTPDGWQRKDFYESVSPAPLASGREAGND